MTVKIPVTGEPAWAARFVIPQFVAGRVASRGLREGEPVAVTPDLAENGIDVRASPNLLGPVSTVKAAGDAAVLTDHHRPVPTRNLAAPRINLPALIAALS